MDLVSKYIKRGRFGKFVQEFLESEYKRRQEKADEERERMLWEAYVHSYSEESFGAWKRKVNGTNTSGGDSNLDDNGIKSIINELFPEDGGETQ